ncbi:cell wall binding repeat 2 family protein [Clostridioides difficile CD45]|uniref:S-layer protein SlpA n=1 Tax=Clostridioides difficile TaxID=1496 RepID=UPI00038CADCA|nr:S-layer protein SlpA [Clostridioides difficile]EGT4017896.1 S-layer protein SlpA [Clostridioides difficile]EJA6846874.1 S-layer protein SlpA [Clostridioides difficile]EQE60147.1 cell wall binding repeat 2 family protein [Clostridioides difficile CD45]MBH7523743.1 S-layer protein SlpA [Clostridioides difficile]MBY1846390.1 S-layer protein SlpA [Clostridioides difficile]
MNKKNIAIAMSGLTVLASAAPVFAVDAPVKAPEGTDYVDNYTIVQSKYEKALKKLQDGLVNGEIKSIDVYFDGSKIAQAITDKDELFRLVDAKLDGLGDGDSVQFTVHYAGDAGKYTLETLDALKTAAVSASAEAIPPGGEGVVGVITNSDPSGTGTNAKGTALKYSDIVKTAKFTGNGVVLTLQDSLSSVKLGEVKASANTYETVTKVAFDDKNTLTKTVSVGDKLLDLSKPLVIKEIKNGTLIIDLPENTTSSSSDSSINLKVVNAKEQTIDLDASSYKSAEDIAKTYAFDTNEVKNLYTAIEELQKDNVKTNKVQLIDGKYQVTLWADGKRLTTKSAAQPSKLAGDNSPLCLVIKADKLKDLKDYVEDLRNANNGYSNTVTVAGDDRIETAIELSRKYYNNTDEDNAVKKAPVDSVVLVGSQAIVDGLVASPLASEKTAPLLLTSKDKLDSNVKSEIKRVMNLKSSTGIDSSKKVYLAGGVNSISKEVENELKDMGLKVTRLSGDDRYATSLEIADEIGLDNDKAFVVGGTGLADAMSIAPVASQLDGKNATPIVVVDGKAKELSSAAEDFLDDAQVDIIGGKNSVSKDMEDAIDDATGKSPNRISGDDRQATNAEVLKESDYFPDGAVNYFVAKDGSTKEDQLVDALAAAPVAAHFEAPIILATDSLSSDQNVAISKALPSGKSGDNLIQVGQGIASSVITKIKDLLDM